MVREGGADPASSFPFWSPSLSFHRTRNRTEITHRSDPRRCPTCSFSRYGFARSVGRRKDGVAGEEGGSHQASRRSRNVLLFSSVEKRFVHFRISAEQSTVIRTALSEGSCKSSSVAERIHALLWYRARSLPLPSLSLSFSTLRKRRVF